MDEVRRFCVRMLGDGPAAREAEQEARAAGHGDRVAKLRAASVACRDRAGAGPGAPPGDAQPDTHAATGGPDGLSHAVALELAAATRRLPAPQREALVLRELLGLPYDEVAEIGGLDADAVALLLARARIGLRAELRGSGQPQPDCHERERALRTIALRQDGQPVSDADDDWLFDHLGHCRGCGQAHAAMLEATACYCAWRDEGDDPSATAGGAQAPAGAGTSP